MAQRQQFLNFDKPEFVDNFVYTPPFEMMDRALKVNQEGLDEAAEIADLLGSIPVDYIAKSPAARAEAQRLIDTYGGLGEDAMNAIRQDSMNWRKQLGNLNAIKNQLSKDFQTGRLSELSQSKKAYDKTMEGLAKIDPAIAAAAEKQLLSTYNSGVTKGQLFEHKTYMDRRDLNEKFAQSLIDKLGGTTNKQTQSLLSNMESALLGGNKSGVVGYIEELMTSTTTNRAEVDAALQAFINEPGNRAYMQQMQDLGLENYFDAQGKLLPLTIKKEDGTISLNPESSLSSIYSRAESLKKDSVENSDKFQYDPKYGADATLAEQKRQFNAKQLEKTIPLQERGGDLKLALTSLQNQDKLKDTLSSVLNNDRLKALLNTQQLQDLKAIEGATLDVKGRETITILQDLVKSKIYGKVNTQIIEEQISIIENTLQEIENTTHQAWTGSPDYNGDPLKLNAARVAFNNAFINTTEADFVIPVAGNDDGYKSKAGNLRDPKLQSSGVGVPGTEITVTVAPKKKGDPTQQGTSTFREYYPNIGTLAYNPLTGEPEIATASNYTQLRAATFNPSNTQEAIPNKDKFVESKQTGTMVPTGGYGVLEINIIGFTPNTKGNYVYGTKNTGNTVYTKFKTQGANSIAPARVTK